MSGSFGSVIDVVAWRLCLGCGVCASVCPNGALCLVDVQDDGIRPKTDHNRCVRCGECIKACPGIAIEAPDTDDAVIRELHQAWGPVLEVWEGYAADPEIRFFGSSGGVVTALSLYCIERAGMSGVLHVGSAAGNPLANTAVVSRSRPELLGRTGSRYAPAATCSGLGLLDGSGPQFVFAGKPCDVAALRKWTALGGKASGAIAVAISIFCAGTPSTRGSLRILEKLGVQPGQVRELRYRGCGWPGRTTVKTNGSGDAADRSMSYEEAWGDILSKHTQFRCRLCPDSTGELADLSCGDPWYRELASGDPGRSLVLARTATGAGVLHEAMNAGYVQLERVDADTVPRSQRSLLQRRQNLWGRLLALRLLGVPVPRCRGFSLLANWRSLSIKEKARSVVGTIRRARQRGWTKPYGHEVQ